MVRPCAKIVGGSEIVGIPWFSYWRYFEGESHYVARDDRGAGLCHREILASAVDAAAGRGRRNRRAVVGAADLGATPTWRIIFIARQGAGAGHSRPIFADPEPDLRFQRFGRRGRIFVPRSAAVSLAVCGAYPLPNLSGKERRAGARCEIRR